MMKIFHPQFAKFCLPRLRGHSPFHHSSFIIHHFNSTSRRVKRGFTLLEVLLSLTVIAFICGLIIGFARFANHNARRHQARADLVLWSDALQRWHDRFGEYPHTNPNATANPDDPNPSTSVEELYFYTEILPFDDIERIFFEQTGITTNREPTSLIYLPFKDPWGMDYRYQRDPKNPDTFDLWSLGPDFQSHTADDIHLTP